MASTGKKWLLGCGLGCGIPLLLLVILTVGSSLVMMKPFNRAVEAQDELAAAHGARADFAPGADSLAPARLEKFLAVRRALVPMCADLSQMGERIQRVEALEQDGEEPSKGEAFKAVGDVMGAALGLAGNIGRFTEARNAALLSEGMGLGEYVWIYSLAYHSWLGHAPNTGFDSEDEGRYNQREKELVRSYVTRQAGSLAAAGRQEEADQWAAEAARLSRTDGSGVPWEGAALPAALVAELEPYRTQLDDLFCAAAATFEFSQLKKKGLSVTAQ